MARKPKHEPLRVLLNNRLVGALLKEPSGAIEFRYARSWLDWEGKLPISMSLPLREDAYRGHPVVAVFDNLLPDSSQLRQKVAEKVGAEGTDAYSLLSQIGRDCVGALQFLPGDEDSAIDPAKLEGEVIDEAGVEALLNNLARAPLGLDRDQDFRISIAGAQEKTALLRHRKKWIKPYGATPTTHIFKTQMGKLPNGIDLSNSVENEYYCLALMRQFGLTTSVAEIQTFGKTRALVIERFDRAWTKDGRLHRLPQEDCCQALTVPPTQKYQSDGGPGMVEILTLLKGADSPIDDQKAFLKAQILFWLIGATDGHAKNFSIYIEREGRFGLTPLYDVISAQPSLDNGQIQKKKMKLAMFVGDNRHYRIEEILPRHFFQTAKKAGLSPSLVNAAMGEIVRDVDEAIRGMEAKLPSDFPEEIHTSIKAALRARTRLIEADGKA